MTLDPRSDLFLQSHLEGTRRWFLGQAGLGIGGLALSSLMGDQQVGAADPLGLLSTPHFAPRARRIICLHMAGSPPQQELFDPKPLLKELDGQPCPTDLIDGETFAFIKGHPKILASPFQFNSHGQSGMEISELLPHLADVADELCLIRSMHTDQFNHAPAQLFIYSGSPRFGRPSMGSWLTWGLGSMNQDLPAFVVLVSGNKTPSAGKSVWGSGFLPSVHQGIQCRTSGDPVLYLGNPPGIDSVTRRRTVDAIQELDKIAALRDGDPETIARIEQYELAFRMQASVPEVMDISRESPKTLEEYGAEPGKSSFANNCLLARRLVEQDVRFVQLFDWGWDIHGTAPHDDIMTQLPKKCGETDQPIAALLRDLRQRGLLDDTLVIWTGEFGRTAMNEERNGSKFLGRDHHPHCYSMWMAGGGVKKGHVHGATDELGYRIVKDPVGVHDLQATILHLMGIDHERLTYPYQGRDFRLTDVSGKLVPGILA
ncbi:MAG: DUF1501 domain-containing protein [Planctomycetota bacterium]|nr:DUF1501 domain-containing protein [Planctomycetota bacterium]